MKIKFDVTAHELQLIQSILAHHLKANCKVWVFGSRAKNSARFNSDLDLALESHQRISPDRGSFRTARFVIQQCRDGCAGFGSAGRCQRS